jgi:hypothetical protein
MKIKLVGIFFFLCFVSCKEEMESNLETEVIEVNLLGTEQYQYKIADAIPSEGGYEIRRQAQNYQISEMTWGEYNYQSAEGFQGSETVEIVLSTSIGDNNYTDEKRWVFEITVE